MNDQARQLRSLFGADEAEGARLVAVASGKGGVGKTSLAVNLAVLLGRRGRRVLIVDADLGLANVDIVMGLVPRLTLRDALRKQASVYELLLAAAPGVWVLPGASGLTQFSELERERSLLQQELPRLRREFDVIFIDTAPGLEANAVAFALAADELLLVTMPEPTALTDAYVLLKVVRELGRGAAAPNLHLILNMTSSPQQGLQWGLHLQQLARRFQDCDVNYLGSIPHDAGMGEAVRRQCPVALLSPGAPLTRSLIAVLERLESSLALVTPPASEVSAHEQRAAVAA